MSELERRAIAEWQRLNKICKLADPHGDAMLTTLAAMNTITRVLGYEPKEDTNGTVDTK